MALTTTLPDTPVTRIYDKVCLNFSCGAVKETGTLDFKRFFANIQLQKFAELPDGTFSLSPLDGTVIFIDDISAITNPNQGAFMVALLAATQAYINAEGI
jgi:hypothetical protein